MPEADGYVRIDTRMDDSRLVRQLSSLGAKLNKQLSGLEQAKQNVEALERAFARLASGEATPKSITNLERDIERAEKEAERYNKQLDALYAERQGLRDKNVGGMNDAAIANLNERIEELSAKMLESVNHVEELKAKLAELKADPTKTEEAAEIARKLELARSEVERLSADADNTKASMDSLRNSTQGVQEETKKSAKAFEVIGNYMKRMAKRMLVLYAFRRVFAYIRNSIMSLSGLGVVTGVFTDFNNKMKEAYQNNTAIQGALAKLRGSLYAAFNPIYEAVVPALVTLINWLSKGIQYIAAFLSALSGKSLQENAAGAKKLAKAVGGVGSAAKEANKQLAQFDRLNTLSENTGGGGGGGGSSGAADFTDIGKGIDLAWIEKIKRRISPIIDDIKAIFGGLIDFVVGIFSGDWELAFDGAGRAVEGFGSLVSHVIDGVVVPVFDGFYSRVEDIIDGLFEFIENKTGLDLTNIRKNVTYALDYMRFYIEGVAIQIGWIVQDLCNIVGDILRGDWQGAWESAQQLMMDASVDIGAEAEKMAKKVGEEAEKASGDISKHSKSSHSSVADAATGVGEGLEAAGNASADFAETFVANMDAVRGSVASMNGAGVQAQVSPDGTGISFLSTFKTYAAKIFRMVFLTPHLFAGGGFPTTGSAFIAGEAGPELVGSFGGHNNSVVNEAQLVQAFRQASSEQVALMQQQNSLLAAILNKSGEVTFKPSSAAGRAFQQSINMYNRAMG